jgi:hypothetical protein
MASPCHDPGPDNRKRQTEQVRRTRKKSKEDRGQLQAKISSNPPGSQATQAIDELMDRFCPNVEVLDGSPCASRMDEALQRIEGRTNVHAEATPPSPRGPCVTCMPGGRLGRVCESTPTHTHSHTHTHTLSLLTPSAAAVPWSVSIKSHQTCLALATPTKACKSLGLRRNAPGQGVSKRSKRNSASFWKLRRASGPQAKWSQGKKRSVSSSWVACTNMRLGISTTNSQRFGCLHVIVFASLKPLNGASLSPRGSLPSISAHPSAQATHRHRQQTLGISGAHLHLSGLVLHRPPQTQKCWSQLGARSLGNSRVRHRRAAPFARTRQPYQPF